MDSKNIKDNNLRKKAEKVFTKQFDSITNNSNNLEEVIYELRVHQIELEIQNQELREAQIKLADSQRKYFDLYNFAPVGYFTLNQKGLILEVNLEGTALLGVERTKLQKKPFFLYIANKDRNKFHKHLMKVLETGTKQSFELDLLKPDNHTFYSHLEIIKVSDENGNFIEFKITVTDIQDIEILQMKIEELSQANKSLRESQKRMDMSQEISHLGSWELDIENNNLSWTDEIYRIFGLQPQEFGATYEAFLDAVHPEDREAVDMAYSGSIREGRDTYEIEHRIVRKSTGEVRIVHEKCEHFRNESGKIIRSVGMVQDITERKKAEEALVESEAKFHSLYSTMSEGVAIHEIVYNHQRDIVDYIITDINQAYEDITGLKKNDVLGKKASELYGIGYPPFLEKYGPVAENGKSIHFETFFEPMDKYFSITITSPEKGKFATFFEDITNRKNYEENLQSTMDRLKQSNKELEQFAYVTSHDLREPLRMISSFLQLLERRYSDKLDDDANEFIGFAVDGAKRLDDMINDLLIYSQVNSKRRKSSSVKLETVLEETLTNLKVAIDENNVIITHDPLPIIHGNEQSMIQLFQNLIGNAIKYRSEETPKIHISVKKEDKQYLFSIKDNGIGIDPKHLEKIFTIFQRLHSDREYEGTGIGLAIAQKIVHQHSGQIWAESEQGKGSTFYFTIPINAFN